jgi:hypothetical protein
MIWSLLTLNKSIFRMKLCWSKFYKKYGWARGLPMVPWVVCIMHKDEGGLGLIDVATQGNILVAKWVVKCLKGSSPWQVLMRNILISSQHTNKVKGQFDLCDIISTPHNFHISRSFIFRSIWTTWKRIAGFSFLKNI